MFLALFIGHLVGDWIVQTDWQAANKVTSWKANQLHVLTYHLTILTTVLVYSLKWPPYHSSTVLTSLVVGLLFVSWPIHSFLDRRWPVKWLMHHTHHTAFVETTLGVLMWDQILHVVTLWLIAVFLLGI